MDNLFRIRTLTTAVNNLYNPAMTIYNRLFQGREHLEITDRLAFDIITGSQSILANISVVAPATVTTKTNRKTVTLTAPRLAAKRAIHSAEMNALRAYGSQTQTEQMQTRIARELQDMRFEVDRTLEYWASGAIKGMLYDADLSTVLVDYGLAGTHDITLTGTSLWTNAASKPINKLREWQRLIEVDAGTTITGWLAFVGSAVMDALLTHSTVTDLIKYGLGVQLAQTGRIQTLANTEIVEYNASFLDANGTRRYFIDSNQVVLVGLCQDLVDVPYAPIVDDEAPGGVGNTNANGGGVMYFAKSWPEKDPSGRWIKVETRPLPVLLRPGAVVKAVVA